MISYATNTSRMLTPPMNVQPSPLFPYFCKLISQRATYLAGINNSRLWQWPRPLIDQTLGELSGHPFITGSHLVSDKPINISHLPSSKLWGHWFSVRLLHLVCFPVSEKVDGAIHPPLYHSPAAWVMSLVTPHLHEAVGVLWLHQVHAAGRVAVFQSLQTILERPWNREVTATRLMQIKSELKPYLTSGERGKSHSGTRIVHTQSQGTPLFPQRLLF